MLVALRIRNLALVEQITIELQPHLNVITGETGAGKSILLGALALMLGERADRKFIRSGEESCSVEAVFQLLEKSPVHPALEELGLPPCEDGQLIIRRSVKAAGASQQTVNDAPVTQQALKTLGELLVDMHGPHDHQSLLSPAFQLDLLDAYGQTSGVQDAYAAVYRKLLDLQDRRAALLEGGVDVQAQIDLLSYRIKEIEDVAPVEGEFEQVEQEHRLVAHAQQILELGQGVVQTLHEGDASAFEALASAQRVLDDLSSLMPEAAEWKAEVRAASIQIQEVGKTITEVLARIEADPARLQWLDDRISAYQKLKRKYGKSIQEILALQVASKERLQALQHREERLAELDREEAQVRKVLDAAGRKLRAAREASAGKLAKAVTSELVELGFPHGAFTVEVQACEPQLSGMDVVVFGFAPNLGEARKPLKDIASSGEISRVMLACKAVLARCDRIPILIFDEVDANIGGEMGVAVGRKLKQLGQSHQVICITHLPQVAVCGATHFSVVKRIKGERTISEVHVLDKTSRPEEIARMLGGKDSTKVTLQHAREMLAAAGA